MQQRYYDPIAGRFLSVDPVVTDANTGKGFGLYTYVDNNPYTKIDPDGKAAVAIVVPIVVVVGVAHYVAPGREGREQSIANGFRAVGNAIKNVLKSDGESKPEAPKGEKPSTLEPGPNAGDSIPARGPGRDFTPGEREQVNEIGDSTGCHTCGASEPGTSSGNWVPDHQPPSSQNPPGNPQRLYPHCLRCSRIQGGEARQAPKPPPPPKPKTEN